MTNGTLARNCATWQDVERVAIERGPRGRYPMLYVWGRTADDGQPHLLFCHNEGGYSDKYWLQAMTDLRERALRSPSAPLR